MNHNSIRRQRRRQAVFGYARWSCCKKKSGVTVLSKAGPECFPGTAVEAASIRLVMGRKVVIVENPGAENWSVNACTQEREDTI